MGSPFRVAVAAFGSLLLLAPTVRALDQEAVNRAIDKGVIHLKQLQRENGTWPHQELGATSLAGLTLLECGVPPNDPSVRSATQVIRQASITCTHTYSIALSILFLDRLGDPADVPLIESMTVRLLAGQNASGGWTYHCPEIAESEIQRLKKIVNDRKEPSLTLRASVPDPLPTLARSVSEKPGAGTLADNKPARRELPKEIQDQLALINRQAQQATQRGTGDNSNCAIRRSGPVGGAPSRAAHRAGHVPCQ